MNFAPVFSTGGGGGTPTKLSEFTNDLTGSSGSWNVPGTLTASGLVTANTGVNVLGANVLNFGSNLTKETNAGKIGYGTLTTNSLDIVGAGTAVGNRGVKLWDNVTVPGTLAVAGSISTPALTVAGASVSAQVNADWNATSGVAQILNKPTSLGGGGGAPIFMPTFTSVDTTGGFTVSASAANANFPASRAFDASSSSSWISFTGTYSSQGTYLDSRTTGGIAGEYLQIQTPAPYQLQSYRLFGSVSHYLTSFAIVSSSDLSTWTTIDTRTNQDCRTEQTYTAPAQTATFIYFRLVIRQDQTTEGSNYTVVSNFVPVFTSGTPTKLTQFTNDLTGSSGSWNVPGTLTASGLVTANTGVNVLGANVLNFSSNLTKETNAGKIGYGTLTTNSLDIVGAGTAVGNRGVKLWDNVTVPGTLAVSSSISTPALTVAGASVFAQVNADWNATSGVAQILNKPTSLGGGGGNSIAMPEMTSNTGNGYIVSASSIFSGSFPAWNAFDSSQDTAWVSDSLNGSFGRMTYQGGNYIGNVSTAGVAGEYLQIQTPAQFLLLSYRLFGSGSHALTNFSIMGSSDLSTWTTIDAKTNQNCRTQQTYTAPVQTTTFSYFRLIITKDVSTTNGDDFTTVFNFAPVFSSAAAADWNATSGSTQILNKPKIFSGTQFVNGAVYIGFPSAFNSTPVVTTTMAGFAGGVAQSDPGTTYMMMFFPYSITASGFSVRCKQTHTADGGRLSSGIANFYYIAVGT